MPYVLVDIVTDDIGVDLKIEYDTESGKIIRPEIYGVPTDEFIPGVSGFFDRLTGKPFGPEPEKIYEASALKYFISDSDLAPNIVVNEEIAVHIDFQRAGSTARHFYSEFLNDLEEVFDHLHREFSQKEFEEILNSHAKEADIKGLEENLLEGLETHETFKTDNRENAIVGRTLENYERFR